jgi:cardiolipin synthase
MDFFDGLFWGLLYFAAILSAGHALLNKRDPRSALGWIVVCLAFPGVGFCLYWLLGVNRIRTQARGWQASGRGIEWIRTRSGNEVKSPDQIPSFPASNLSVLLDLSDAITRRPLVSGNRLEPLLTASETFEAMLKAITKARKSIYLSTYIFGTDSIGRQFIDELKKAAERGVDVRVLVDALGEYYSLPTTKRLFRRSKVKFARFLPPFSSLVPAHLHLRNHRKMLIVDGEIGFAGGMNIGKSFLSSHLTSQEASDLHFRVRGPVVGQIQDAFLEDWQFVTQEAVPEPYYPPPLEDGEAFCRGISAGPNEDFEKLRWLLDGCLNSASQRVRIMTPYFIPSRDLVASINSAVLRGVKVEIILPGKNNLPYVHWASRAMLWELLEYGAKIYYRPPPFSHSKLLLVDNFFALIGSANLDTRSLRLNFEFNLEVFDPQLVKSLVDHFNTVLHISRQVTLEEVDSRPLPIKMRDSFCKLFSPYL